MRARPAKTLGVVVIATAIVVAVAAIIFGVVAYNRRAKPIQASYCVGRISHPPVSESSGVIASRRYPGVFWTHNDRGNAPALFAIKRNGDLVTEVRIGAKNQDWEDIAIDNKGRLYIAQTGNNDHAKTEAFVLRIAEPDPHFKPRGRYQRIAVERKWELRYPDRPFDSEALFILGDHGYLISKDQKNQAAQLYRFPLSETDKPLTLEYVTRLPIRKPVTAADVSPDGKYLAVAHTGAIEVFQVDGRPDREDFTACATFPLSLPHDIEGCCFTPEGILATSETREAYLFPFTGDK